MFNFYHHGNAKKKKCEIDRRLVKLKSKDENIKNDNNKNEPTNRETNKNESIPTNTISNT